MGGLTQRYNQQANLFDMNALIKKRVVIYCRASLDITGQAASVTRQETACRALCAAREWVVAEVVVDNSISAYREDTERPGWSRVLRMVEGGEVDVVVAWHLDRMTRSMLALERLIGLTERHGVGVATATGDIDLTTDVGRMVARILAAVARAEVERKGQRQKLANEARANSGGRTVGVRPFGYEDDQMSVREDEALAIKKAAGDVLAGVPLTQIARDWKAAGFISSMRRGGEFTSWSAAGARVVLTSPRYIGKRVYKGKVAGDAQWPAILDEATFYAVDAVLKTRGVDRRPDGLVKGGMKPVNLLSNLAVCGKCGSQIRATSVASKFDAEGKRTYAPVYQCKKKCLWMERMGPDEWIAEKVIHRFEQPDLVRHLIGEDDDGELEALRDEAVNLRTRRDFLAEQYALGSIAESQFTTGSGVIAKRLDALETRLAGLVKDSVVLDLVESTNVRGRWETMGLVRQRAILAAATRRIGLHGEGKGRVPFLGYPDSIGIEWVEAD